MERSILRPERDNSETSNLELAVAIVVFVAVEAARVFHEVLCSLSTAARVCHEVLCS